MQTDSNDSLQASQRKGSFSATIYSSFSTFADTTDLPPVIARPDRAHANTSEHWVWEAAAGPGPDDPFRKDWKHWAVK
jgi:hypothetical protein